jgi:hypothetical protein
MFLTISFTIGVRDYTLNGVYSIRPEEGEPLVWNITTQDEQDWKTLESLGEEPYTSGDSDQDWQLDLRLASDIEVTP